jgi:hypothetical protein
VGCGDGVKVGLKEGFKVGGVEGSAVAKGVVKYCVPKTQSELPGPTATGSPRMPLMRKRICGFETGDGGDDRVVVVKVVIVLVGEYLTGNRHVLPQETISYAASQCFFFQSITKLLLLFSLES